LRLLFVFQLLVICFFWFLSYSEIVTITLFGM
jgi:hypothetical protein